MAAAAGMLHVLSMMRGELESFESLEVLSQSVFKKSKALGLHRIPIAAARRAVAPKQQQQERQRCCAVVAIAAAATAPAGEENNCPQTIL